MRLLIPICLPAALAQLGSFLALANHARFFKKPTTTSFRQYAITLYFLVETPQQGIEGLVIINDNLSHPCFTPLYA
jgi:hypothetical protein